MPETRSLPPHPPTGGDVMYHTHLNDIEQLTSDCMVRSWCWSRVNATPRPGPRVRRGLGFPKIPPEWSSNGDSLPASAGTGFGDSSSISLRQHRCRCPGNLSIVRDRTVMRWRKLGQGWRDLAFQGRHVARAPGVNGGRNLRRGYTLRAGGVPAGGRVSPTVCSIASG